MRDETDAGRSQARPYRVLVVSADMGGGHNATAAALEEEVLRRWPGSTVRRVDALDLMGIGRFFRWIYVSNVEHTPWLYEFFYSSLWRHRWFADASKRFTGTWCGRRLAGVLDRVDPDLVLCTYPLGSSGLAWLRRHRGLAVPTAAWVSDFSPHPFWVYGDVDLTVVLHEAAALTARAAEPAARVVVGPPPVVRSFRPGDQQEARRATGLSEQALTVLVSCGSYSFGDVTGLVRRLVEASPDVSVVAVCGRNARTAAALTALGLPPERLRVLGWVDDMPPLVRSADLVLTNAGGATALEALASGVPVLMVRPIAAHGEANADLMVVSGLADLVTDPDRLGAHLRSLLRHPPALAALRQRTRDHLARTDLTDPLALVASLRPAVRRPWRLRAGDALFAAIESDTMRQELGVVCELGTRPDGNAPTLAGLRDQVMARIAWRPTMRRRLVRGARPGWRQEQAVDPARHVTERRVATAARGSAGAAAVDDFWSTPLPEQRPGWQAQLISGELAGEGPAALVAFKLHHSAADGVSALGLLGRLLDVDLHEDGGGPEHGGPPASPPVVGRQERSSRRRQGALVARGLVSLAAQGFAPRHPLNRPVRTTRRQVVTWDAPRRGLTALTRAYDARPHEVVLTLVADALGRALGPAGLLHPDRLLRVMVPVSMRPVREERLFANWTGTVSADVPVGSMPFVDRLAAITADLRRRVEVGEPEAAAAVVAAAGLLPAVLRRAAARAAYADRFFATIVSYLPGPRGARSLADAPVRTVYPVLPLAPGVPVAVGVITFSDRVCVGVTLDPDLGCPTADVRRALDEAWAGATAAGPPPVRTPRPAVVGAP